MKLSEIQFGMFILDPGIRIWIQGLKKQKNTAVSVLDDLGLGPVPESAGLYRTKNVCTVLTKENFDN
jgi:hypothetical protein